MTNQIISGNGFTINEVVNGKTPAPKIGGTIAKLFNLRVFGMPPYSGKDLYGFLGDPELKTVFEKLFPDGYTPREYLTDDKMTAVLKKMFPDGIVSQSYFQGFSSSKGVTKVYVAPTQQEQYNN